MSSTTETTSSPDDQPDHRETFRTFMVGAGLVSLLLVFLQQDRMTPDALGYLRGGHYWASGQFRLASGAFWGPLLGWLSVPWMWLGVPHHIAGRISLMVCALVLVGGLHRFFAVQGLRGREHRWWTLVGTTAACWWVGRSMTGDLPLATASMLLYLSLLEPEEDQTSSLKRDAWTAFTCCLCYWAKPVGLPFAILVVPATWVVRALCAERSWKDAARRAARTLGLFALFAAPWVSMLSWHYGQFTMTRSARINHVMVSPDSNDRFAHPSFVTVHHPGEGRISSWEDPTSLSYGKLDHFVKWDKQYFKQLGRMMRTSLQANATNMFKLDLVGALLLATLLIPLSALARSKEERDWRTVWLAVPWVCKTAIYLPFHPEPRYFWCVLAPSWCALALLGRRLVPASNDPDLGQKVGRRILFFLLALLPLAIQVGDLSKVLRKRHRHMSAAKVLAEKIRDHDLEGPLVSWAPTRVYTGVATYAGWLLERPWMGAIQTGPDGAPRPEDLAEAQRLGARILVVVTDAGAGAEPAEPLDGWREVDRFEHTITGKDRFRFQLWVERSAAP